MHVENRTSVCTHTEMTMHPHGRCQYYALLCLQRVAKAIQKIAHPFKFRSCEKLHTPSLHMKFQSLYLKLTPSLTTENVIKEQKHWFLPELGECCYIFFLFLRNFNFYITIKLICLFHFEFHKVMQSWKVQKGHSMMHNLLSRNVV